MVSKNSHMKKINVIIFLFFLFACTSCQVIGDIFGAGVYTGIFLVILVIVAIVFILSKLRGRK